MTRLRFALGNALSFIMIAGTLLLMGVRSSAKHEIEVKYKYPSAAGHKAFGGSPMPLVKPAGSNSSAA